MTWSCGHLWVSWFLWRVLGTGLLFLAYQAHGSNTHNAFHTTCLKNGKFHVVEDAVIEVTPKSRRQEDISVFYAPSVKGDRIDFAQCMNLTSVYNDGTKDSSLPVQDTYSCQHIRTKWPEQGYIAPADTWPRLEFHPAESCAPLTTIEATFRNNVIDRILKPNSKIILFGDSKTRQLFISIDCRLNALGIVKERRVLSTYVVPRKDYPYPGLRDLHVRDTMKNGAILEFYYTTVPGSVTGGFGEEIFKSIAQVMPNIIGADIVVIGAAAANNADSYYNGLKDGVLTKVRDIWKLPSHALVFIHPQIPQIEPTCSKPTGERWGTCPWVPLLIYETEQQYHLVHEACKAANVHLIDARALLSFNSDKVIWSNGTIGPLQGFWYCDRQHQLQTSGLPDTIADVLWSMLTELTSPHQKKALL